MDQYWFDKFDQCMATPQSRRALLKAAGGGLAAAVLSNAGSLGSSQAGARNNAQPRVYRIGQLSPTNSGQDTELIGHGQPVQDNTRSQALRNRLRELGYIEGQNVYVEYRAALKPDRLREFAIELSALPVDVIVAGGAAALPAVQAVKTTPIVILVGADPVASGLVGNLSHPGGNVTGVYGALNDSVAKGLRLLKEAVPPISHVAALWYRLTQAGVKPSLGAMAGTAKELGIRLDDLEAQTPGELSDALDSIIRSGANGLVYIQAGAQFGIDPNALRVVEWANANRLPAAYAYQEFVEAGGLMAYTWSSRAQFERAAGYIDKILRGAKPGDLPMEGPTELEFLLNLKTARTLGLTIPQSVIDQVGRQPFSRVR